MALSDHISGNGETWSLFSRVIICVVHREQGSSFVAWLSENRPALDDVGFSCEDCINNILGSHLDLDPAYDRLDRNERTDCIA